MNLLLVLLVVGALIYIALGWLQAARRRRLGLSDALISPQTTARLTRLRSALTDLAW